MKSETWGVYTLAVSLYLIKSFVYNNPGPDQIVRWDSQQTISVFTLAQRTRVPRLYITLTCPGHVSQLTFHIRDTSPVTLERVLFPKLRIWYEYFHSDAHAPNGFKISNSNNTINGFGSFLAEDANKELSMQIRKQLKFAYLRISFPLYPFQDPKVCI